MTELVHLHNLHSSFDMLDKNLDITNHQWNIQVLMMELFKTMNNLAPRIVDNMITNFQEFAAERQKTVRCGLETESYCCQP